ncbi:MAG: hypothetical protein ACREGR_01215 [Minisyncoccia bacterium]
MPSQTTKKKLESILNKFDPLSLECDGFTRVASYALSANEIYHNVLGGYVDTPTGPVQPHFWIEVDGWTVDYRLRMWAGDKVPHGVFVPPKDIVYHGEQTPMQCNKIIFDILTGGMEP